MKLLKKGTRVQVTWLDIQASLHSEEEIEPSDAVSLGCVESHTRKYLRLVTSWYPENAEFNKLADRIVIPNGCIEKLETI